MKQRNKLTVASSILALSTAAGPFLLSQGALAQDSAIDSDDRIVVTARKKEQSIQDVPLAITALDTRELKNAGFENIVDVAKAAPGLFVETINDRNARVATSPRVRGVTFDATSPLLRTATIFVDGIIVTGGVQSLGVQELERVEIIKGPQSALFGRNTFSGAINYVTKDPSDEFRVDASLLAATRGEYRVSGTVEGPIFGDVLRGRINANYDIDNGHYTNANDGFQALGDESNWSVSGALVYEPADNFRIKMRGQYYAVDDGPAATARVGGFSEHNFGGFPIDANGNVDQSVTTIPSADDLNAGLFTESVFRGTLRTPDASEIGLNTTLPEVNRALDVLFDTAATRGGPTISRDEFNALNPAGLDGEGYRLTFDAGYEFENGITLDVLAGYNKDEFLILTDFDSTATFGFLTVGAQDAEDISVEARLAGSLFGDRLDWTVGGSYVDVDVESRGGFWDGLLGFWFNDIYGLVSTDTADTYGVFGILDYSLTDRLKIIFEGRYQWDTINSASVRAGAVESAFETTFTKFLPRALIQFEPTDGTLLYANYSIGNLPGGFNPEVAQLSAAQLAELRAQNPGVGTAFREEKLENFELGWKQSALDGALSFNLAGFYMKRSDQIFSGFQIISDPGTVNGFRTVAFTDNGATTDIYGVELDAAYNVNDNLSLQGSFAYIDASVASFPPGAGAGDFTDVFGPNADPAGQQAARFPPWAGSLSATYEAPIPGGLFQWSEASWYARSDAFYTGSFFDEVTNTTRIEDAIDLNLRFGIRTDNIRYEIFATNLTDEDAPVGANNIADTGIDVRTGSSLFDFNRESTHIALRDRRQFGFRIDVTF